MEDWSDKLKFALTAIIICCVTLVCLSMVTCCMTVDYRIQKAIESGADPIAARAAFTNDSNQDELLVLSSCK